MIGSKYNDWTEKNKFIKGCEEKLNFEHEEVAVWVKEKNTEIDKIIREGNNERRQ